MHALLSGCGGIVTLGEGDSREITTPNFPNNYAAGSKCTWLVKVVNFFKKIFQMVVSD